ncbi:helix-turn-helix domain-containing protein [Candidatus Nomurabacteria bacterium]|nr:helix-turn-helix domain-containing protein [Candidatus Nomurabacteria bacterium]
MDAITLTKDELSKIIAGSLANQAGEGGIEKTHIKGIHARAKYLGVSPTRAQKLKNDGVFPYFQNGRLVLFDRESVKAAMACFNQKSQENG